MKTRTLIYAASVSSLAALALSGGVGAQERHEPTHYRVIDLGTLGRTVSAGNAINNVGWVTGFSNQADGVQLATLWVNGLQIPLAKLGGPGGDATRPVKNNLCES